MRAELDLAEVGVVRDRTVPETGPTSLLGRESNELCPSFSHPPEGYTARSGAGLHHYHVGGGPGRADLKKNVGVALEVIAHLIRTGHPVEALGPRCGRAAARFSDSSPQLLRFQRILARFSPTGPP